MVKEGIILGNRISKEGLEVDQTKIEVIEKLPPPSNIKGIIRFLGHVAFYRRFVKDFPKITKPLYQLLQHDAPYVFSGGRGQTFKALKKVDICTNCECT